MRFKDYSSIFVIFYHESPRGQRNTKNPSGSGPAAAAAIAGIWPQAAARRQPVDLKAEALTITAGDAVFPNR
jgi:hypothetical protein